MLWTGSSAGIAMCHIAVVIQKQRMSAYGTKQTFSDDSQNDCFGVLSGRSADQCLLLGVKQPGIGHRVFGCF
jgi:hypothetical protein